MRERIEVFWCKDTGLQGEGRQAGREAGRPADEQTDKPCMVTGTCSGDSRHTRGWPKMLGKFWGKHSEVMNVTFDRFDRQHRLWSDIYANHIKKNSLKLD